MAYANNYRVVVSPEYTEYFDSKSKAERAIRVWFKKGRLEGKAGDKWLELPMSKRTQNAVEA